EPQGERTQRAERDAPTNRLRTAGDYEDARVVQGLRDRAAEIARALVGAARERGIGLFGRIRARARVDEAIRIGAGRVEARVGRAGSCSKVRGGEAAIQIAARPVRGGVATSELGIRH